MTTRDELMANASETMMLLVESPQT